LLKKILQPDRRCYTFMIVPHHGNKVFRIQIPIRFVKAFLTTAVLTAVIAAAGFAHYQFVLHRAQVELDELQALRATNMAQASQLDQLAKHTALLQEEMSKLNELDAEVRRLLNKEELPGTSRAGIDRSLSSRGGVGGPSVKPQPAELDNLVKDLQAGVKVRGESLAQLRESLVERNERFAATPSIWPTDGVVTSRFGWRWGGSDFHPGIDIAADSGTPIMATAAGVVITSGWNGGYGRQVTIDHGYGITTTYAHNSEIVVSVGQTVKKGQLVAYMGSTGFSTGPHCHYEVRMNGTPVNPASFL
jgi:murein DD-endopeptidase MepM/ murein hydrolase activator NlpD